MKAGTRQQRTTIAMRALAATALAALLCTGQALADTPRTTFGLPSGLPALPSLDEAMQRDAQSGLALRGFDPVAYQLEQRAVAGHQAYEIVHGGVVWRFVSAANREAFRDAPSVYAPAFAGFDASAIAQGRAVDTDPRQFAIIGSRLFLFRTPDTRRSFVEDAALRKMADGNWSSVQQTIAR